MKILAIDPGSEESATVIWDGERLWNAAIAQNHDVLKVLRGESAPKLIDIGIDVVAIEMVASYGMPVGRTVFDTVVWVGRFYEAADYNGFKVELTYRQAIKVHHCRSVRAKDSNIRQALIDKYGPPGTKKAQGKTYGLHSHMWAAFALATYHTEQGVIL